jgi:prolyl-tRNA synthetase
MGEYTGGIMRQSQLFTKTRREAPADEEAKNAQLLVRAGFVHKEMSGVYSYLPLGLRVLNNIVQIIREEMNAIGGQEIAMSALQDKELWSRTDRWDDEKVDNWFKTSFKSGGEVGLGITHEEPLTRIMTDHISSYRDLPRYAYQFQNKFRNELRAKSGIMRGKEFLMKDLYSFSKDDAEHDAFFAKAREAYKNVFNRTGVGDRTYVTFASGGIFSEFSEEFQTVSEAGEDTIYIDEAKGIAINKEVYNDEVIAKLGLSKDTLVEKKAIEAGNIFNLGTRFSDSLGLTYTDEAGARRPVVMGSYGIGPTRLMGIIVETLSDDKGMVWPEAVAPFRVHLVSLVPNDGAVVAYADKLYEDLAALGIEALYDDRDARAGEKLADADLIGIPTRIIIGKDTIASGKLEVVNRATGEMKRVTRGQLLASFGAVVATEEAEAADTPLDAA